MKVDVLTFTAVAFVVGLFLSSVQLQESVVTEPPPALLQGVAYAP